MKITQRDCQKTRMVRLANGGTVRLALWNPGLSAFPIMTTAGFRYSPEGIREGFSEFHHTTIVAFVGDDPHKALYQP
jgi:hypothetical protein